MLSLTRAQLIHGLSSSILCRKYARAGRLGKSLDRSSARTAPTLASPPRRRTAVAYREDERAEGPAVPGSPSDPFLIKNRSIQDVKNLICLYAMGNNGIFTAPNNRIEIDEIVKELCEVGGADRTQNLERLPLAGTSWRLVYTTVQTTSGGKFGPYDLGPWKIGPFVGEVRQVFDSDGVHYKNECSFGPLKAFVEAEHGPAGAPNDVKVRFTAFAVKLLGLEVARRAFKPEEGKGGLWHMAYGSMEEGIRILYSDNDNIFILFKED